MVRYEVDRRGRFYETPDGVRYPSVTNIVGVIDKPALRGWVANQERAMVIEAAASLYADLATTPRMNRAAYVATLQKRIGKEKAHTKAMTKAADIGTECHELIEWNLHRDLGELTGAQPVIGDKAAIAFAAYERWRLQAGLTPKKIEQTVWSRTHGYAGTMDLYGHIASLDAYAILDWKTSKGIYEEMLLQSAAYVMALCEMGHAEAGKTYGMIVRFPKTENDPQFEVRVIPPDEIAHLFESFLSVKRVWEFVQGNSPWVAASDGQATGIEEVTAA